MKANILASFLSLWLLSSVSMAAPSDTPSDSVSKATSPRNAIAYNPLVPAVVQLIRDEIGDEADIIGIGARDMNFRAHRIFDQKLGLTIQLEYTQATFFTRSTHFGIRGGPRFSLRESGLRGWYGSPFMILGRNVQSAGTYSLASWTTIGLGGELGYAWLLGPVLFELGLGAYVGGNVGFRSYAEALDSLDAPEQLLGLKPLLTMGVGYAF